MNIQIKEDKDIDEMKITIECKEVNEDISKLILLLDNFNNKDKKITGVTEGELFWLKIEDIYYFETVDKKCFAYLEKDVYETNLKLYEIEENYNYAYYMRISKSCIVNINKIKSIRPDFAGKILATMMNDEKIYISRQYVSKFKKKIGIGGN